MRITNALENAIRSVSNSGYNALRFPVAVAKDSIQLMAWKCRTCEHLRITYYTILGIMFETG